MKVLVLTNNQGGFYKFRKELLIEMIKSGYKVYLSVPVASTSSDDFCDDIKNTGCEMIENTFLDRRGTNPVKDCILMSYYKKLVIQIKPDVVLTYTIKPNVYGGAVCRRCRIPFIVNVTGLGTAIENKGILRLITLTMYKVGIRKAHRVFFQNEENLKFMTERRIVRNNTAELIPGSGVNTAEFPYVDYPYDDERIVFSTFGRIMKDKGIDELLEAAEKIKKKYENVTFRLVGYYDEDYKTKIDEMCNKGTIVFIPFQKDIHKLIADSHAIIHPSYHEGMSNVLQEASASGRPVLAGNISGCKEIFDDGITGIGFDIKNTDSLVRAIERFMSLTNDQKREMGIRGHDKMLKEFDRQIVVNKYMQEMEKINGRKSVSEIN